MTLSVQSRYRKRRSNLFIYKLNYLDKFKNGIFIYSLLNEITDICQNRFAEMTQFVYAFDIRFYNRTEIPFNMCAFTLSFNLHKKILNYVKMKRLIKPWISSY